MDSYKDDLLIHSGVKGMRWGVRRYQNYDGSLTSAGKRRYNTIQQTSGKRTSNTAGGGGNLVLGDLQKIQLSNDQTSVAITYKGADGKPIVYYCNPKTGSIITETEDHTTGENRTRYGILSKNDPSYSTLMTMANKVIVQNAVYKSIKNTVSMTRSTKEVIDDARKQKKNTEVTSVKRGKQRNEYTK